MLVVVLLELSQERFSLTDKFGGRGAGNFCPSAPRATKLGYGSNDDVESARQ